MEKNKVSIFRLAMILLIALCFSFLAIHLYSKQKHQYNFLSFRVENEEGALLIPNIDRLFQKINNVSEFDIEGIPVIVSSSINFLIDNKQFKFRDELSENCFLSFNQSDFSIAFYNTGKDKNSLVEMIQNYFNIDCRIEGNSILFNELVCYVSYFGKYLVVSNQVIDPKPNNQKIQIGNADYIYYKQNHPGGVHYVIEDGFQHTISEEIIKGPKSAPNQHLNYLSFVPAFFDELNFYGSKKFGSDQRYFFSNADEGSLNWVDGGLIVVKKDSFFVLIAPQNFEHDLKLDLEEQTFLQSSDTSLIPYFNIGPFEIMPFKSNYNWHQAIPSLHDNLNYYTSVDNFNVLTNSIPAMRWYLGELQLGSTFLKNGEMRKLYQFGIPQRAHQFTIENLQEGFHVFSYIWRSDSIRICTRSKVNQSLNVSSNKGELTSFPVDLIPTNIQIFKSNDSTFILIYNSTQIIAYTLKGEQRWKLNLSSPLVSPLQIIDLENDKKSEVAIFQSDQIDIVNVFGKSCLGFPKKLNEPSKGGIAVNYDNAFNYRFLISTGNTVKSIDESGNYLSGWMFEGMSAALSGTISYYITKGKDMITFKDLNNKQYVLSRRGESRLTSTISVNLPNESDFVVGNLESTSLRKLGYKNNVIYNHYLLDGVKDSLRLDKQVNAIAAKWMFNDNQPLLVIEENERVILFDEFGYEKNAVLKPESGYQLVGVHTKPDFQYVFVDNSKNHLYLLDRFGKMVFPLWVKGSSVFLIENGILYTFAGNEIIMYAIN